jgi:hypothetical protein
VGFENRTTGSCGDENRPDGAQGVGLILGVPVAAMFDEAADEAVQPKGRR